MNKKAQAKNNTWMFIGLAIVALYIFVPSFQTGVTNLFTSSGSQDTADTSDDQGAASDVTCALDNTPTITPAYLNAFTAASVTQAGSVNWVDGQRIADVAGAFNSVAGQPYRHFVNTTGDYAAYKSGETKCQSDEPIQVNVYPNGTLTLTYFNSNDAASTAEAVGTSGTGKYKVKLRAPIRGCFGNPYAGPSISSKASFSTLLNPGTSFEKTASAGIIVGMNYNTSIWNKVELTGGAVKVGVPQQSVGTDEEAYKLPIAAICDDKEASYTGSAEADTGVNPGASDDPTATFYDADIFLQTRSDEIVAGVEDVDGNDQGFTNPTLTLDFS